MGCNEQHYPLIFNAGPLFKINYFQTMGHHLFFPKSLRGDYKIIQEFSERNKGSNNKTQKIDFSTDDFSSSNNILSPTVCFHCFSALANTTLEKEYYSFTGTNKCVRQERSAATGLERLNTFNMREAIFIGDEELIKNTYRKCESFAKDIFGKKLNLKFRIKTANDPFFGRTGVKKQIYQRAFTLKLEIQVYLPYVEKYVACGSINNHISTMSDAFQFKSKSGNKYESMCIGIGFERLALAILAQKGFSSKKANEFIYSTSNTIG